MVENCWTRPAMGFNRPKETDTYLPGESIPMEVWPGKTYDSWKDLKLNLWFQHHQDPSSFTNINITIWDGEIFPYGEPKNNCQSSFFTPGWTIPADLNTDGESYFIIAARVWNDSWSESFESPSFKVLSSDLPPSSNSKDQNTRSTTRSIAATETSTTSHLSNVHLASAAIGGAIAASVFVALVLLLLVCFLWRRQGRRRTAAQRDNPDEREGLDNAGLYGATAATRRSTARAIVRTTSL
nr:uncharacterized protein CTRU02_08061 [Colletotrichum truncatum]KAF6790541.1 hypothetical protein CTRU02_08061 [Colletotrichum truncatum]